MTLEQPKPVVWVGSSLRDMRELPAAVRRAFGLSLFAIQCGETPPAAKPLRGLVAGCWSWWSKIRVEPIAPSTQVRFETAIYVLHVFQKKSKSGRATPRGVSQSQAAKLLGTTQPQISALMGLKPVPVSIGRLLRFLNALGQDVEVTVKPARRRKAGTVSLVVQPS
ncbi:MAG TPA: XRE family transcriptional regulator [Methyloceanibacter sp.]|nr:XRE family transcriptional regulator [Methyloceanibacter sp.]